MAKIKITLVVDDGIIYDECHSNVAIEHLTKSRWSRFIDSMTVAGFLPNNDTATIESCKVMDK